MNRIIFINWLVSNNYDIHISKHAHISVLCIFAKTIQNHRFLSSNQTADSCANDPDILSLKNSMIIWSVVRIPNHDLVHRSTETMALLTRYLKKKPLHVHVSLLMLTEIPVPHSPPSSSKQKQVGSSRRTGGFLFLLDVFQIARSPRSLLDSGEVDICVDGAEYQAEHHQS